MRSRECDEEEIRAKQEGDQNHNHQVNLNQMLQQQQPSSVSSSRQWTSAFRNPRIVRVSRTFGGKDRHSKVCTVRGLRDRRIRLSVPTAIQLYDLQDRLGLSQPSKVIDWLLEAAKDDVDKLPPLQFPHGFNQMYPNLIFGESSSSSSAFPGTNLGFLESWDLGGSSSRSTRSRIADTTTTTTQRESFDLDKGKWIKNDENSNQDHHHHVFDTNHQHFSLTNPYNNNNNTSSYYNLGHLQHSLDQSGNNVTVAISNPPNNNNLNLPPPSSSAGDGSQLFFGPTPPAMSSLFPTYPSFLGASHHHHHQHHQHHHVVDGAGNLQLFSSNANTASQQQIMTGNTSLIRPFHHLMSSNHNTDRHSSDNDSDS